MCLEYGQRGSHALGQDCRPSDQLSKGQCTYEPEAPGSLSPMGWGKGFAEPLLWRGAIPMCLGVLQGNGTHRATTVTMPWCALQLLGSQLALSSSSHRCSALHASTEHSVAEMQFLMWGWSPAPRITLCPWTRVTASEILRGASHFSYLSAFSCPSEKQANVFQTACLGFPAQVQPPLPYVFNLNGKPIEASGSRRPVRVEIL